MQRLEDATRYPPITKSRRKIFNIYTRKPCSRGGRRTCKRSVILGWKGVIVGCVVLCVQLTMFFFLLTCIYGDVLVALCQAVNNHYSVTPLKCALFLTHKFYCFRTCWNE